LCKSTLHPKLTKYQNKLSIAKNIVDILTNRAKQTPNATAFIFLYDGQNESRITYSELLNCAQKIAVDLKSTKNQPTNAILIYPTGLDFIIAFLACMMSKTVAIPLAVPKPGSLHLLKNVIKNDQPDHLLCSNRISQYLQGIDPSLMRSITCVTTDQTTDDSLKLPFQNIEEEDMAFLQYTSGSTGNPKGVKVSHFNLMHNLEAIKSHFQLSEKSVSFSWLPHYHDMGLVDGILGPIYCGCLGILMAAEKIVGEPVRWLEAISKYRVTHTGGPNFMFDLCREKISPEQKKSMDLSSLKDIYVSAEPVRKTTLVNFTQAFAKQGFSLDKFTPGYGLAEATLMVSCKKINEECRFLDLDKNALKHHQLKIVNDGSTNVQTLVGLGEPVPYLEVMIIDPDTGKSAEEDQVGEIWLSGPSVAQGYWNNTELTNETFNNQIDGIPDSNFLRTSDLGFLYQGQLFITGRLDDVIVMRGAKYYPEDIEYLVQYCHPQLRKGGGIAFQLERNGSDQLVILHELCADIPKNANSSEIYKDIRYAVFNHFGLTVFDIVLLEPGTLQKTSSGKPRRRYCKNQYAQGYYKSMDLTREL